MSERVNISYSVELDELNFEVQRLILKGLRDIQELIKDCNNIDQEDVLVLKNSETIDEVRRTMARADLVLADAANIINGYLNYKSTPAKSEESSGWSPEGALAAGVPVSNHSAEDMLALKDKLEKFKESMAPDPG
jgi:hypothetical protein